MTGQADGKLAENILLFARTLRQAGMPVGTGEVVDALFAVTHAGIGSRRDVYWALRSILVKRAAHIRLFNQAFHLYFRNPRLLERMMAMLLPTVVDESRGAKEDTAIRRLMESVASIEQLPGDDIDIVLDHSGSWSDREMLRSKDFEQMTLDEQRAAERILRASLDPLMDTSTRRFQAHANGDRPDLRGSLRQMMRKNAALIPLPKQRRRRRPPDLVLLADISGSMSAYSRMFLHFAHALSRRNSVVNTFVFGTRLSNITRRMQHRDVDESLQAVSNDVRDWDGGTRIAACLRDFNVQWGRRVLSRNAVLILLSDGLERDTESDLEFQMARLHRSCKRLIWMNPMLRYEQFEPRAQGVRKMLPHVDDFISAHNINSLSDMWQLLQSSARSSRATASRVTA